MPIKWINQFLRPGASKDVPKPHQTVNSPKVSAAVSPASPPLITYPPIDQGLPVRLPEEVVKSSQPILDRLQLHAAQPADVYQLRFLDPMLRLASHVNTLPASAADKFAGEGGLMRACLEMGFFSYQASDGRIFTGNETVERRHALESRWRYVCFLAGLLYPVGQCLDKIVVVDQGGHVWKKHHGGVTDWATSVGAARVFASWSGDDTSSQAHIGPSTYTSSLLPQVVGPHNLQWLEDGSAELVKALYDICSGQTSSARNAQDVVVNMWDKVAQREESRRPQTYGRLTIGSHLGPYLVGALNALVEDKTWSINVKGLIADASGLYLVWPDAGKDIIAWGQRQGYAGWPANASTIAELLKTSQIVETNNSDDYGLHELITQEGEIVKGFKIINPLAVVDDFDAANYSGTSTKRLDVVMSTDPLATAGKNAPATAKVSPPKVDENTPVATAPEVAADEHTLSLFGDDTSHQAQTSPPHRPAESADQTSQGTQEANSTGQSESAVARIKEGQEVKYADLVPDEIRKEFKRGLTVELLGKVIKAWKTRGEASKTMRMTDNGAAFSLEFLSSIVRDTPKWVSDMADAGLIYSPSSTPGLKIIKVAIPEGSKPREAVVLSRYAVKKLGL